MEELQRKLQLYDEECATIQEQLKSGELQKLSRQLDQELSLSPGFEQRSLAEIVNFLKSVLLRIKEAQIELQLEEPDAELLRSLEINLEEL